MLTLRPASAQAPSDDYILGSDDVITVSVIKHPEFSGDFLVPSAGTIELPVVGSLKVKGMTLAQVDKFVTDKLSGRLKKPEVAVTLKIARLKKISVVGAVMRPGPYEWKPGWRVNEALGAGGGLPLGSQPKDYRAVILRAEDGEKVPVSIQEALAGDAKSNLPIQEGDVLSVEAIEQVPIWVLGRVKTPALYKMPADSVGIVEALTMAGGPQDDAEIGAVKIIHSTGKEETVDLTPMILRGEKVALPKLLPNDLIMVTQANARVAVFGTVGEPGFVPIPPGKELKLSDAIAYAKPDPKRSRLSRVGLVREVDGKQQRLTFDVGKFIKTGDPALNPTLRSGDVVYVPESNAFTWSSIVPGLSLAALLIRTSK